MNVRTATLNTLGTTLRVAGLAGSLLGGAAAIDEVSIEAIAAIVVGVAVFVAGQAVTYAGQIRS
jgi:hypothetical protein